MAMSSALARKETEIERKIAAQRLAQRAANLRHQYEEKSQKLTKKVEDTVGAANLAVISNGGARVGGIFLESYLRKKIKPENQQYIGPVATGAAAVCYLMSLKAKGKEKYQLMTAAGGFDGIASRWLIEQADKTFNK